MIDSFRYVILGRQEPSASAVPGFRNAAESKPIYGISCDFTVVPMIAIYV